MKSFLLLFCLRVTSTQGFVVPFTTRTTTTSRLLVRLHEETNRNGHHHADTINRLTTEYQQLQRKLWTDIRLRKRMDALKDLESMVEHAVDMTALERYRQEQREAVAQEEEMAASEKAVYAQQLKEQAHRDLMGAQDQAALIESIEAGYEDLERLRDLSVAHAASDLEHDADELAFDAAFEGFVAKINKMQASDLLKMLHDKEKSLQKTLRQVRDLENQQALQEWAKSELPKHEQIIKVVKSHKLIDHDPTKGNVAF